MIPYSGITNTRMPTIRADQRAPEPFFKCRKQDSQREEDVGGAVMKLTSIF